MDNRLALIALNLIPEIRAYFGKTIIENQQAEEIFHMSEEDLLFILHCKQELSFKIKSGNWIEKAEEELEKAKHMEVEIITYYDEDYPDELKMINNSPLVIYKKGNLSLKNQLSIAVVGTRYATTYGLNATDKIVSELTEKGFIIISGFARGIDTCAHKTCLKNNGKTVAVLGCGLDIDYPVENSFLKDEICKNGAIITEYPFSVKPYKNNFPLRNRIISALSIGVLIIEASYKSGSLITVKYALEQGKEVFSIPGSIFSMQSIGTNYLIKSGQAKLTQSINDIIAEIPNYIIKNSKTKIESPLIEVDEEEKKILKCLPFEESIHVDDLVLLTGLSTAELLSKLLILELKGAIIQTKGQCYCKKILI